MELKLKLEVLYKKQGPKIFTSKPVPWLTQGWGSDVGGRLTEETMEDFPSSSAEPFDSDLLLGPYFNLETLTRFFSSLRNSLLKKNN